MHVYLCGDTAPGLNTQNKQAMQFIAYEKKEGVVDGSRPGTWGGDIVPKPEIAIFIE